MPSTKVLKFGASSIGKIGSYVIGFVPPFSATDITDCVLWLNNTSSSMTLSGSNKVSEWRDLSGLNHHFTQATGANQPTFVAGGINGQNGVQFSNSVNQTLDTTFSTTYSQNFEIFTVWNLDSNSTQSTPIVYDRISFSGNRVLLYWASNNVQIGSPTLTTAYAKTRPFDLINTNVLYSGASTKIYENGVLKNTLNTGTNGLTTMRLGNAELVATNTRLSGYICEIIIYSRELTNDERSTVNTYLATKYGL